MASLPTATNAKTIGLASNTVAQEIFLIWMQIIAAAQSESLAAILSGDTVVDINGVNVTGSIMTFNDNTGHAYYNTWKGTIADAIKENQMQLVIDYFTALGYTIVRKSTTGTEIYWSISW